jgi:hypothetical protein
MISKFNIEDAETLRDALSSAHTVLQDQWSIVATTWQDLQTTWDDPQRDKFEGLIEKMLSDHQETEQALESHSQTITQQIQKAQDKAAQLSNLG